MEEYEVEIIDMNEDGIGIARIDGMVLFIPGLVTGDRALVSVTERRRNFAEGALIRLIQPSESRIRPLCPFSSLCGGCTLSHITFEEENNVKKKTVMAALRRAGLDYSLVSDTISTPERTGYRNKIAVHYDRESRMFGYCRAQTNEVLPFDGCLLCPPVFSDIIRAVNFVMPSADACSPTELQIRSTADGVTVSLYTETRQAEAFDSFRRALMERFTVICDVLCFAADEKSSDNKAYFTDQIGSLTMRFTTEAFRQVNRSAFERLLTELCRLAGERPFTVGADLYCGSGIIGLTLAKAFPGTQFDGIEINPDAIEDARCNAQLNGIGNIRFFCGDSSLYRAKTDRQPELIVVDPPRAGLSPKMREELAVLHPERILYVSCNPQTLARDAAALSQAGYTLSDVIPVNMFPMTRHVECVVLMSKATK